MNRNLVLAAALWGSAACTELTGCHRKDCSAEVDIEMSLLQTSVGMQEAADTKILAQERRVSSRRSRLKKDEDDVIIVQDVVFVQSPAELIAALVYFSMLTIVPFACSYARGEDHMTFSRKVIGLLVIAWNITAVVGFTQFIYFESNHWHGARHLNLVECLYVMTQFITTVGYGDIYPAFARGQVCVAVLIAWGLLIVADAIGNLGSAVFTKLDEQLDADDHDSVKAQAGHLALALAVHFLIAAAGVLFDVVVLDWTFEEAFFSSVVTLSTVGLGVFTTGSKAGQLFVSFWMLFGTASLANLFGCFGSLMIAVKNREDAADTIQPRRPKLRKLGTASAARSTLTRASSSNAEAAPLEE